MEQANAKDLIVLTADPQMQGTIATLLTERRRSLGISDLTFDVRAHPDRDSGCRTASASALSPLRRDYRKAMVIFDFHGSGAHSITVPELESQLERQLETAGWSLDDVAVVVIEPELEAWIFGASWRHLEDAVRWSQSEPVREWLESREFLQQGVLKPSDPKAAFEALLSLQRIRRSGDLFVQLAKRVSLARCQDRAFQKFRATLQRWFPAR
jgi:hypothetical protein